MRRNCSFTPKQLGLFYLAQSVFALLVASFFWFRGVRFVMPFTLVELVILAIALVVYARHTTDYESLKISEGFCEIESCHAGYRQRHRWNALWVTLSPDLNERDLIVLSYQGKQHYIGRFLTVTQRRKFLKELQLIFKSIKL
jgi:uncharacterized membrane protein